jgi:hypothetical protein
LEKAACKSEGALPLLTCEISDDRPEAKLDCGSPDPESLDVLEELSLFTASNSECMNCCMSCWMVPVAEVELASLPLVDDDAVEPVALVAVAALLLCGDRPRLCSACMTACIMWPPPCILCGRLVPLLSESASELLPICCACKPCNAVNGETEFEVLETFMFDP